MPNAFQYIAGDPLYLLAAVAPPAVIMYIFYKVDSDMRPPAEHLWPTVLAGIIATFYAGITNSIFEFLFQGRDAIVVDSDALFYLCVALSEEFLKCIGAVFTASFVGSPWRPEPDRMDFVLCFVFVSMGFAAWENIDYVYAYGLKTAFARAVLSIPAHACFGILQAMLFTSRDMKLLPSVIAAILAASAFHFFYDWLAGVNGVAFIAFFVVMVGFVMWILWYWRYDLYEDPKF